MAARELVLLVALLLAVGAAVVLYVLAPSGRLAWLLAITFGSTITGLLLARSGRPRRPRTP
ncbi:MAG TPA: hypothetical protein PLC02_05570 [Pseudomonadota bacterium]|nr:hypothetical protein [Pseudomonadota bacterium]